MREAWRTVLALLVAFCVALPPAGAGAPPAAPPSSDAAALAAGTRQVEEGDFEGAIATLDPVADRLVAKHSPQAALACVPLGVAHIALDQRDLAKRRFRQALDAQPELRLGPDRHSPKVISAFEEARRERDAEKRAAAAGTGGGGGKKGRTLLIAGAGVAVGVGIAVLAGGSSSGGGSGTLRLSGARFTPASLTCPNGAENLPLTVDLFVEAANDGSEAVRITAASSRLVITNSPGNPGEVGFPSSLPTSCTPTSVPPGGATLHVATTLACANGAADAPRFNEWQGTVAITTPSGTFSADTPPNGLRVTIP